MFCLADVAKALGYSRPADAVNQHCKGLVILPTPTNGGIQEMKFGKESEVYRLTMKSKLPDAVKSRLEKEDLQLIDLHALKQNEGTIAGNSTANFITESGFYDVLRMRACRHN